MRKTGAELSAAQENQLNALDTVFKALGRTAEIVDSIDQTDGDGKVVRRSAANAQFDPETNTYRIAVDGIGEAYMYFAVHESVHDIRVNNAQGYARLENMVFDFLRANGQDVDGLVMHQRSLAPGEDMAY